MFEFIQEAAVLPKLSQTSVYKKFDNTSHISDSVIQELKNGDRYFVKPNDIQEILSIIQLNGDPIVKKAVNAYTEGRIVIIFNKDTSHIPNVLPFIVISNDRGPKCYIFADRFLSSLTSNQGWRNLMAVMEAGYLALCLQMNQSKFTMNAQMVLTLCDCWLRMFITPLELKLYMKGDNLTKAMVYGVAFFYKMILGKITGQTIPFKRFIGDKIDNSVITQVVQEVDQLEIMSIFSLIELIKNINPVRYADLEHKYISLFLPTCGYPMLFALENLQYVFLLITSAIYKANLSEFALNKIVSPSAKKAQLIMVNMNI